MEYSIFSDLPCYICFSEAVWVVLLSISLQLTEKLIVVYPNSGEVWDGRAKRWLVSPFGGQLFFHFILFQIIIFLKFISCICICIWLLCNICQLLSYYAVHPQPSTCFDDDKFELFATRWYDLGASLIGGCCRTTPSTIQAISKVLKNPEQS